MWLSKFSHLSEYSLPLHPRYLSHPGGRETRRNQPITKTFLPEFCVQFPKACSKGSARESTAPALATHEHGCPMSPTRVHSSPTSTATRESDSHDSRNTGPSSGHRRPPSPFTLPSSGPAFAFGLAVGFAQTSLSPNAGQWSIVDAVLSAVACKAPGQMGRRVLVRTDASHGCGPRRSFQSRTCRRLSSSQHRQQTQGLGSRRNPVARLPRGAPVIMLKHLLHPSWSCSPVSVNACRLDRAGVPRHASNTHVAVSRAQVS